MNTPPTPEMVQLGSVAHAGSSVLQHLGLQETVVDYPEAIYFECHVTIDPVMDATRIAEVDSIGSGYKFKRAKLLMVKGNEQVMSDKDTFLTAHANPGDYEKLVLRMNDVCRHLESAGFAVRRAKIEAVVLDSRYAVQPFQLKD